MVKQKKTGYAKLQTLPLGDITASGWLRQQLERSKEGMGGHLGELEPHMIGEPFVTGKLEEKMPPELQAAWCGEISATYWNGLIELAYTLQDRQLIEKATKWVEGVLANQREDGYLGTYRRQCDNPKEDYNAWSNALLIRALLGFYEATERQEVLAACHKGLLWFVENWKEFSFYAGPAIIEPLILVYQLTDDLRLKDYALRYESWLCENSRWPNSKRDYAGGCAAYNSMHAVAYGIDVLLSAITYTETGDQKALAATENGLKDIEKHCFFHTGGVSSNFEYLSPVVTNYETEYCNFTVFAYAFEQMCRITGKAEYGDKIERIVFNGAQGARKKDERAIAYMSSPNQLFASKRSSAFGAEEDMGVYAPNYPVACCPAHSVRIMPEFVRSMCMKDGKEKLYFFTYGPCQVKWEGRCLDVQTQYPFRDTITLKVRGEGERFTLKFRIPQWCQEPELTVCGEEWNTMRDENGFVEVDRQWNNEDTVVLRFPMQIWWSKAEDANGKHPIVLERGPLVYAKKIEVNWKRTKDTGYTPLPEGWGWYEAVATSGQPHVDAQDRFDFNYALVEERLDEAKAQEQAYAYPWEDTPVKLVVFAEKAKGMFPPYPIKTPDLYENPIATDKKTLPIELVPYGCTNLRITYFPKADRGGESV